MKLIVDWGVHSPRLDRLIAAECSHCDGPIGWMARSRLGLPRYRFQPTARTTKP